MAGNGKEQRIRYSTHRRGRLVVDDADQNPLYDAQKDEQLNMWWERDVAIPFFTKAQIWIPDQGSKAAAKAGMNIERESHEMAEDSAAGDLEQVLASSNGLHFGVDKITERAKRGAREMEYVSGRSGWTRAFLLEFVDILGQARGLSARHKAQLKTSIIQHKLQI